MTDIEAKALALVNGVRTERGGEICNHYTRLNRSLDVMHEALYRAIEQHEAFKQEVSDAVEQADLLDLYGKAGAYLRLQRFIIAKPKPDPLVEVMRDLYWVDEYADDLRAALEARGLEIRSKSDA
jgi:hypothetical protein